MTVRPIKRRRAGLLLGVSAVMLAPSLAQAATLHVRAGAPPGGTGTPAAPFASLAALQAAGAPGDRLVVDPAPASVPPLDGGIALKPDQALQGGGPAVTRSAAGAAVPALTNTSAVTQEGDAVRLADGASVRNVVIRNPVRGGVYGSDSVGVTVDGVDVSGHNASCSKGFLVQPFSVPTGVPYAGSGPVRLSPQNGWAAIMVDGQRAAGSITFTDNYVHDAGCGDGLDIRAAGSSKLTARVDGNRVERLAEGEFGGTGSVLAIGMQARDTARLEVSQADNTQLEIGSEGADCEGQFANTSESGVLIDRVTRNVFKTGIGGFSCNGFEAIVSNGNGTIEVDLTDSVFEDNEGDMFEEGNLGVGSTMRWNMERVVARGTRQRGQNAPIASDPGTGAIPFNLGDCMVLGHTGQGNRTELRMVDTVLEDCNNGISALAVVQNSIGKTGGLLVDIDRSRIARTAKYGIQFLNGTPTGQLRLRMADTQVTGAGGYGVAVDQVAVSTADQVELDLGGGVLGSPGGNCLTGNAKADLEVTRNAVPALNNWWGQGGGPRPEQIRTSEGTADTSQALDVAPACGPQRAPVLNAPGSAPAAVKVCSSKRSVSYTLPRGAKQVRLTVGGKRQPAKVAKNKLKVAFDGLPRRAVKVVITARVGAKRYVRRSTIHPCTRS